MIKIVPFTVFVVFMLLLGSACKKDDDLIPNPGQSDEDSMPDTVARVHFVISHGINTPSAVLDRSKYVYKYDDEMKLLSVDVYLSDLSGSLYYERTDEADYSLNTISVGFFSYQLNELSLIYQINQGNREIIITYDSLNRKTTERSFKNGNLESEHRYRWNGNLMVRDSAYFPDGHYPVAIASYKFEDDTPQINPGNVQSFGESNAREPSRKVTRYFDEDGLWKYTTYNKYAYEVFGDSIIREDRFWNSTYVDSLSVYQWDTYSFKEL